MLTESTNTSASLCHGQCSLELGAWDLSRLEGEAKELTAQGTLPKGFLSLHRLFS